MQALICVDDATLDVLPQYQARAHAGEALFISRLIPLDLTTHRKE